MSILDAATTAQLKAYLANLRRPIELVASLGDDPKSGDTRSLVDEIAALSDKVTARHDGTDARRPSFAIRGDFDEAGHPRAEAVFAGLTMGHEFTSLILALLHVGGHPPKEDAELLDQVRALDGPLHFETFFSQSCQNCPDVVQALNMIAALNPKASHVAIDGALFKDEVERRQIMAVPTVFLNGELFGQGRMDLAQIVAKLDTGSAARAAEKIGAKDPFDVLIVGGGPAGAAAAIYAARKGIRTGIVAERFGGQVLDTMGIENFISVPHTEGPKLVSHLEQHVRDYEVDVMNAQKAVAFHAANGDGLARSDHRRRSQARAGRDLRADRPGAQHRMAAGIDRAVKPGRDRDRPARRNQPARRLRRRRRDDRALQADRDRDGRGQQGGAFGVRLPDPALMGRGWHAPSTSPVTLLSQSIPTPAHPEPVEGCAPTLAG